MRKIRSGLLVLGGVTLTALPSASAAQAGDIFGACCDPYGDCSITEPHECVERGYDWLGKGTVCDPNPCPPTGACCDLITGNCSTLTSYGCFAKGDHIWQGADVPCSPNPCEGACCFEDTGRCSLLPEGECEDNDGEFLGDFTLCSPNPCPVPPPPAGKAILVDQSHQNAVYSLRGFLDHVEELGWNVTVNYHPITESRLAPFEALIVPAEAHEEYMPEEAAAIASFVAAGKGLWGITNAYEEPQVLNSLFWQFGITGNRDYVEDPVDNDDGHPLITRLADHPITEGVSSFRLISGTCLNVAKPALAIAEAGPSASTSVCPLGSFPPVLVAAEHGAGRVVVLAQSIPLSTRWFPERLDEEEVLLLENLFNYVANGAGPTPTRETSWGALKALFR